MAEHLEKQPLKKAQKPKWRNMMNLKNKIMTTLTIMKIVPPIWTTFQVSQASLDQKQPRLRTKRTISSIDGKLSVSLATRPLNEEILLSSKILDSRGTVSLKRESPTHPPDPQVAIWEVSEMKDFPRLLPRTSKESRFKSVREQWEKMATRSTRSMKRIHNSKIFRRNCRYSNQSLSLMTMSTVSTRGELMLRADPRSLCKGT